MVRADPLNRISRLALFRGQVDQAVAEGRTEDSRSHGFDPLNEVFGGHNDQIIGLGVSGLWLWSLVQAVPDLELGEEQLKI